MDALFLTIGKRGRIRLPLALLKAAGIKEGDQLEVRLEAGSIVLTPAGHVDGSQSYYWTEAWQKAEREADKDIEEGRVVEAGTVEELFDELDQGAS